MSNFPSPTIKQFHEFSIEILHPCAALVRVTSHNLSQTFRMQWLGLAATRLRLARTGFILNEVVAAFDTLLIEWSDPSQQNTVIAQAEQCLKKSYDDVICKITPRQYTSKNQEDIYRIPVCYHEKYALDKAHIETSNKLTFREVIQRHTSSTYTVNAVGFMPGFAYLGDIDPSIAIARQKTPRSCVPKNSVAIGESNTAVYPCDAPGGWNIIGKAAIKPLANIRNRSQLADAHPLLIVGQHVQFFEISEAELLALEKEHFDE